MDMAYTTNPKLPKVRMEAVRLVKYRRWSTRQVARHTGFSQSAIVKWCKKDPTGGWRRIETASSRPHHHPKELSKELVQAILNQRRKHRRCSEVVWQELANQGLKVSLSSVKRTLNRRGLIKKRSPWKRYHPHVDRPLAQNPGDLVQIDTIHIAPRRLLVFPKFYVYTLLDVFSRWAFAKVSSRINTHKSLRFLKRASVLAPFPFAMLQSDHGPEFSAWFTEQAGSLGLSHRHSRVRMPNDNGHLERFNRTIQEECLNKVRLDPESYQRAIDEYLPYYNNERMHLGLNFKTPAECFQAPD